MYICGFDTTLYPSSKAASKGIASSAGSPLCDLLRLSGPSATSMEISAANHAGNFRRGKIQDVISGNSQLIKILLNF
jgi:hypothetical protein